VILYNGATANTIGGASFVDPTTGHLAGAGNLMSGLGGAAIWMTTGADGNTVQGNFIGTDITGKKALPDDETSYGNSAVSINTSDNLIGGASTLDANGNLSGLGNLISANNGFGVNCYGGVSNNHVEGNFIGTDVSGKAALGNAIDGVLISGSSNNTIGGTATGDRNIISGNSANGVEISGGATGNVVEGDYLGTDVTGTAVLSNSSSAVFVQGADNTIGGLAAAARNVIAGTGYAGIRINGTSATGNTVENNYIGLNAGGTGKLGSLAQDIGLEAGTSSNTIGTSGAGNVLAGAAFNGISVYNDNTNSNVIAGNYIGTDATGTAALGNSGNGIGFGYMYSNIGASNTQIMGNLISANGTGIGIDSASHSTLIAGNYIGTNAAGTASLANGTGVFIAGYNNTIGGTTAAARNVISGNANNGVDINGSGTTGNVVEGNYIGTNAAGTTSLAVGSATPWLAGVMIENGASGNLIGTNGDGVNDAAEGNLISGNIGDGVALLDGGTNNNIVAGNLIGTDITGQKSIANDWDGILITFAAQYNRIGANGADVDAAAERNVISGNTYDGVEIGRTGTNNNWVAGNYIGTNAAGTAALANGGIGVWIWAGAQSNVIGTNGDGIGDAAERNIISGNNGPYSWGVDITGSGTNNNVLAGNYIGTDKTGTQAIPNGTPPSATSGGGGVVLDSQAAFNRIGTNGDGVSDNLERNVISGNSGWDGLMIQNASNNVIAGNYIGTAADGLTALANSGIGIDIKAGSKSNRIGVNTADLDSTAERNVISGNGGIGILIWNNWQTGTASNVIAGNYIGTDKTGTTTTGADGKTLGNAGNGIVIFNGTQNNTIGGTTSGAGNVIAGNASDGILITDAGTTGNVVAGNYIGTNAAGTVALANSGNGITISNAPANTIGGTVAGAGNVIAFNAGAGVAVTGSTATGNAIRGNLIYSNTGLGIDLGGTGAIVTNDSQGHNGPNNYANYPVLNSVTAGPTTVVSGTLQNASTPGTIYYLDFYANTTPNASGHGDAQVYLGSATVTTDSTGLTSFSVGGLGATSTGQYVTVTATDQYGNTSEFALNAVPAVADSPPSVSISGPTSLPASGIPIALSSNLTDSQTGKTYTYAWNVTSTTDPSFALPAGTVTDEPNLTFTPSAAGTYVATLSVTDSLGGVGQATPFTIAVGSGGQMVALANSPASAAVNTPLTLTAAITEPSGVRVANYDWNVTLNGTKIHW